MPGLREIEISMYKERKKENIHGIYSITEYNIECNNYSYMCLGFKDNVKILRLKEKDHKQNYSLMNV